MEDEEGGKLSRKGKSLKNREQWGKNEKKIDFIRFSSGFVV